jgi:hypothetical protein
MADPTGRDNAETAGSLPPGVGYVDAPVIRRKAVAMLAALGCSILEYPNRDEKAAHEYRCLTAAVFGWPYLEVSGETTEG